MSQDKTIFPRVHTDPPSPEYVPYFLNPMGKHEGQQQERPQSCLSSSAEAYVAGGLKEEWRTFLKSHWKSTESKHMLP